MLRTTTRDRENRAAAMARHPSSNNRPKLATVIPFPSVTLDPTANAETPKPEGTNHHG